jgi:hypothetical protein
MLGVDLDGSRRLQKDRLDEQMDDHGASDRSSDDKASNPRRLVGRREAQKVAGPSGESPDAAGSGLLLVRGGGLSWLAPGVTLCLVAGSSRRECCSSEILR